jgi:Fe-S-cluster containining protein
VFAINQLDAIRLRKGLADLKEKDPQRADRILERARASVARLSPDFPGDVSTGLLNDDDSDEACKHWDEYGNSEPCPVLDPAKGTCELYESRPVICRTFGPALTSENDLGHCELCFIGATEEEVIASEQSRRGPAERTRADHRREGRNDHRVRAASGLRKKDALASSLIRKHRQCQT